MPLPISHQSPLSNVAFRRPESPGYVYVSQPSSTRSNESRVEQVRKAHRDLDTAYQLTQAFASMLLEHRGQDLDDWLTQAKHSGIRELKSFAQGIRCDYAAVRAAFSSQWSNGQVNCLKLQKRMVLGRANFDLLRLRVLHGA